MRTYQRCNSGATSDRGVVIALLLKPPHLAQRRKRTSFRLSRARFAGRPARRELIGRKSAGVLIVNEYAMPPPAMQRARRRCSMIFLHGAMTFLTG
jgi:hypothetical protein